MLWTADHYPNSMRKLPEPVRLKAIETANALLRDGMHEGLAIPVAIVCARQWAQRRGLSPSRGQPTDDAPE